MKKNRAASVEVSNSSSEQTKRGLLSAVLPPPEKGEHACYVNALGILEHTAQQLVAPLSSAQLTQVLVENAAALVSADLSVLGIYDSDTPTLRLAATNDAELPVGSYFTTDKEQTDWGVKSLSARESPSRDTAPHSTPQTDVFALEVPLVHQGQAIGLLCVFAGRTFSGQEQRWLQALAGLGASALFAAQLLQAQQHKENLVRHTSQLEIALRRIGRVGAQTITKEVAAKRLLAILHTFVPFESGVIYARAQPMSFSVLAANHEGRSVTKSAQLTPMSFNSMPLLHELTVTRKPIFLADATGNARWRAHLPGHTRGSWAGIPLFTNGLLVGLLFVGTNQTDFFTRAHQNMLQALAVPFAFLVHSVMLAEREKAERERLSTLTQQVLTAQEEERKRVSREIHDEAGQSLTALTLSLEILQDEIRGQNQALLDRAREAVAMTRRTLEQMRQLAYQLRPPALDTLGLGGALEQLCLTTQRQTGLAICFTPHDVSDLSEQVNLVLYRFVQEALTNVNKHAGATQAKITIVRDNAQLLVSVNDDGKGFDPNEQLKGPRRVGHLGLLGMKERLALVDGTLEIHTVVGKGTVLLARVPLQP